MFPPEKPATSKPAIVEKHRRFALEYLKDLNARAAAARAGYDAGSARELLAYEDVQDLIREEHAARLKRLVLDADEVLQELHRIAMADPADAFDASGSPLPIRDIPVSLRRSISGYEVEVSPLGVQTTKVKFWNKNDALVQLGRHLKLFIDQIEVKDDLEIRIREARERALP